MKRRQFIKYSAGLAAATTIPSWLVACAKKSDKTQGLTLIEPIPASTKRHWLGKSFWGNRLQDWQVNNGRIECLNGQKTWEVRTVSLLTRRLLNNNESARIRVKLGQLEPNKASYAGFLLGVGQGELDQKGCSIVQRSSGTGGGIMATVDHQGNLAFKDFSSQKETLNFKTLASSKTVNKTNLGKSALYLDCQMSPAGNGLYNVNLSLLNEQKTS